MIRIPSPTVELHRETLPNGLRVVLARTVGAGGRRRRALRRRLPLRAGGPHRLRPPVRAPDVPGLGEPGEARALPLRAVLAAAPSTAARTSTTPTTSSRCPRTRSSAALFLEADRMRAPRITEENLRQPARRGQGGDPGQRAEPALRRVPVDHAAAGAVRHLRQRAQRLRRLRGPGSATVEDARRSSTPTTRRPTRCSRSAGTSRSTPPSSWCSDTSATIPARPVPVRPSFAEPPPDRERRRDHLDRAGPAARAGHGLPDARSRAPASTATSPTRCSPRC